MRKQGRADRDVMESSKREPNTHSISLKRVAQTGLAYTHAKEPPQLYPGRGYEAPMNKAQSSNKGSQGKY